MKLSAIISDKIAQIYSIQGDNEKAIEYYKRSYKRALAIDSIYLQRISLNKLAFAYQKKGKFDLAISFYEKIIALPLEDYESLAACFNNVGNTYAQWGKIKEANNYYHQSIVLFQSLGQNYPTEAVQKNIDILNFYPNKSKSLFYFAL